VGADAVSEHVGRWHALTVEREDDGLEYDIEHPDDCPKEVIGQLAGFPIVDYACDMAVSLANSGVERFEITEPGTYRARCRLWSITLPPWLGSQEWDEAVEIERESA
jgi:hypothetical protein